MSWWALQDELSLDINITVAGKKEIVTICVKCLIYTLLEQKPIVIVGIRWYVYAAYNKFEVGRS